MSYYCFGNVSQIIRQCTLALGDRLGVSVELKAPRILQILLFRNPKGRRLLRVPQNPAYGVTSCSLKIEINRAHHAWSLAKRECAICRHDASTRTVAVELRERKSQVVGSRRLILANATHDNRNTSWLDASRQRSDNILHSVNTNF